MRKVFPLIFFDLNLLKITGQIGIWQSIVENPINSENGKPWRGTAYWSPHDDEGPYADKINLENLNLEVKQKFLYLYDFGDEWMFSVLVEKILETDIPILKPMILESRGEAPEQY